MSSVIALGVVRRSIVSQMFKMFGHIGTNIFEFEYAVTPKQLNGFECGDLAFAMFDLETAEYASPKEMMLHTALEQSED